MNHEDIKDSKQMWDSEKRTWIPFDLWGAHFIVNERKEHLVLRIYRVEPGIEGWNSIDSSYLNNHLKEDKSDTPFNSFAGFKAFYEMIRQDRQEYQNEGRIMEIIK